MRLIYIWNYDREPIYSDFSMDGVFEKKNYDDDEERKITSSDRVYSGIYVLLGIAVLSIALMARMEKKGMI